LIVANISENDLLINNSEEDGRINKYIQELENYFYTHDKKITIIPLCIALEYELQNMNELDKNQYKEEYKLDSFGIDKIILESYQSLGLISFFTCGPKEIHAWTIPVHCSIKEAAGEIHSDLQKGFISAQVIAYSDLLFYKSELNVKNEGKIKMVGGTYIMQDGDIINVNFNV
jgi:ribosome-binding ATPase YchF (GTP1/OBG family)